MSEATITLDSRDEAVLLFGSRDQYLREIRTQLGMQQLVGRGDQILLKGTDEQLDQADARLRAIAAACCASRAACPARTSRRCWKW